MEEVQRQHIHIQLQRVAALCIETASQEGTSEQVKKKEEMYKSIHKY